MIKKAKEKDKYGRIVNCEEADVLDTPEHGAPKVGQLLAGRRVTIVSKPNKNFVGIQVSPAVFGFVLKEFVKAE